MVIHTSALSRIHHGKCGEGDSSVESHTLVWWSVQFHHELQELEEEDKGREEVQEIERESQGEEKRSDDHDHVDGVKGLQHFEARCVCG